MAKYEFKEVKAGDLIEAKLVNRLIAYAQSLEERIATLEAQPQASDRVRIDSITPLTDPITENDLVSILGVNFSPVTSDNLVTVGQVSITQFKAFGTDRLIQFTMPKIPSITAAGGASVPITVRNKQGSFDTKSRVVKNAAAPTPHGTGLVTYTQALVPNSDGLVHAKDQLKITYRVTTSVVPAGTYQVDASTDAGWPVQVVGGSTFSMEAAPGGEKVTKDVTLVVTVPDNGVKAVLSVTAKEVTAGSSVSFGPAQTVTLTVGQKPQSADAAVVLYPGNVSHGSFSGSKLAFTRSFAQGAVGLMFTFGLKESYKVDVAMSPSTGWTLTKAQGTTVTVTDVTAPLSSNFVWSWSDQAKDTDMTVTVSKQAGSEVVATFPISVALT